MEGVELLKISDLLRHRRPTTGAATLLHPHPPPPLSPPSTTSFNPNSNPTSSSKFLKPLPQPSFLTGVLSLPSPSLTNSHHSCFSFSFSDASASLCCDVLHFDLRMIGLQIYILAFNFIPFPQCAGLGLLEIIHWKFVQHSIPAVDLFPLIATADMPEGPRHKADYCISGVVESVSPVSGSNLKSNHGFIAEILACDCMLCKRNSYVEIFDHFKVGIERHDFSQTKFVYFSGATLFWHPVVSKLIKKVVYLSGLSKKTVYVGEEEGQTMLVSTTSTCLRNFNLQNGCLLRRKLRKCVEGKGELTTYVGVVRGISMKGMLIELDEDVWLLLTDQLLNLPHSVRVGAVLSIRNVHIVNPKFVWSKMLILGACYKTTISVVSFSPLETRCLLLSQSQSWRFLESLTFPVRLWVLLVVKCLTKKFPETLSGRKILGSKHKGMVEAYARSVLPSSVFLSRRSMFMEFCKHGLCGSGGYVSYVKLSLAVPFYNLIHNCGKLWIISLPQMKSGLDILENCGQVNHLFQENRPPDENIRRILPSEKIRVSLLGNIKISPATGRLQFIDETGSIDAIIPDLPSLWDMEAIYEVFHYSLVLEGSPDLRGETWIPDGDLFSCGNVFRSAMVERQTKLAIFVHFAWSDVIFRELPVDGRPCSEYSSAKLDHGTFHLLYLSHKFPVQSQLRDDLLSSGKCFLFAEAVVLPCVLIIAASDCTDSAISIPQHERQKTCQSGALKRCIIDHELEENGLSGGVLKRYKTTSGHVTSFLEDNGLCNNLSQCGNRSSGFSSSFILLPHKTRNADNLSGECPIKFPCTVIDGRICGQRVAGVLCLTEDDRNNEILQKTSPQTVLLEFNYENYFKYKLLNIGGYYLIKHCVENCFCEFDNTNSGFKVINLETHLWSLSFQFNEVLLGSRISNSSYRCHLQNELFFQRRNTVSFYDVILDFTEAAMGALDLDHQAFINAMMNPSLRSRDLSSIFEPVGSSNNPGSLFQSRGTYSGNHLPQGTLISLVGTVVSLHSGSCSAGSGATGDVHLLRFAREEKHSICLHVLTDGHMVVIDGYLSKHDYPVGLGPGADVTFHRIFALSGQDRLTLLPVSVIAVNSIREVLPSAANSFCFVPKGTVPSWSISRLIKCDTCKPRKFRCRVVSVHIVMLERIRNLDKLLPDIHSRKSLANVPVAGFILDDGSSQCCCWANGARAAKFLRLHEEMPPVGFERSWWRSDRTPIGKGCCTPSLLMDNILKRHGRVTLKNFGSMYESVGQDLNISVGSDNVLGSQDENLLKLVILNACSNTYWSVIGHVMDSTAINEIEKCLLEEQMNLHALQNVWAREVSHMNIVAEARALYEDL